MQVYRVLCPMKQIVTLFKKKTINLNIQFTLDKTVGICLFIR